MKRLGRIMELKFYFELDRNMELGRTKMWNWNPTWYLEVPSWRKQMCNTGRTVDGIILGT